MSKNKFNKNWLIIIGAIIAISLIWADLTLAGYIDNYLNIEFLCPESSKNTNNFFQQEEVNLPQQTFTGGTGGVDKPVIYFYPEKEQDISVKIDFDGIINTTYPAYNNGWKIKAYPNGKLFNYADERYYSYLFWEGLNKDARYDLSQGFIVKGTESISFLQSKLSELGLKPEEYNEFIVYWLPYLQKNEYNLVHFATAEEYGDKVKLNISPKPDSVLRVFMVFKETNSNTKIKNQKISPFNRKGFTVVEWGGSNLDK